MSHQLKLFSQVKIGELFFRDPFKTTEGLSIKVEDNKARNPQGEVKVVHPHVLVFTADFSNEVEHDYRIDHSIFATGKAVVLLEAK